MERDPRIDPVTGDIVRAPHVSGGKGVERHVVARRGGDIDYVRVTLTSTSKTKNCWISTWRQWCHEERVEIVQRGQ